METQGYSSEIKGSKMANMAFSSGSASNLSEADNMNSLILLNNKDSMQKDLIESCKAGDQKAQLQLYKVMHRKLCGISLKLTGDTASAEEIVQESFLVAFERIHAFTGGASFVKWVIKMVQDSSIECWRKRNVLMPEAMMDRRIKLQKSI